MPCAAHALPCRHTLSPGRGDPDLPSHVAVTPHSPLWAQLPRGKPPRRPSFGEGRVARRAVTDHRAAERTVACEGFTIHDPVRLSLWLAETCSLVGKIVIGITDGTVKRVEPVDGGAGRRRNAPGAHHTRRGPPARVRCDWALGGRSISGPQTRVSRTLWPGSLDFSEKYACGWPNLVRCRKWRGGVAITTGHRPVTSRDTLAKLRPQDSETRSNGC